MSESNFEEKRLAYDLRTIYVINTGGSLIRIEKFKAERDYPAWIREMQLLFPIIYSRIDKDREKFKQVFEEHEEEVKKVTNKYPQVYRGTSKDHIGSAEIEEKMSHMLHFLYRALHISHQFGDSTYIQGLE